MRILIAAILAGACALPAIAAPADCPDPQRVALARDYARLTYAREIVREVTLLETEAGWRAMKLCDTPACETRLHAIVGEEIDAALDEYENATTNLLANRLSREQLEASVAFARSPTGRAIAAAGRDMVPEIAVANGAFSLRVSATTMQRFCAAEGSACKRLAAQAAPAAPAGSAP